mmetsp:Transcript_79691/g.158371  ORF Transcript_79691/g.158371 Transcript_79691/m.158371 type:complete len:99 (+) Transcript_79691:347-643(+)
MEVLGRCVMNGILSIEDLMATFGHVGATASVEHHRKERFEIDRNSTQLVIDHVTTWVRDGCGFEFGYDNADMRGALCSRAPLARRASLSDRPWWLRAG